MTMIAAQCVICVLDSTALTFLLLADANRTIPVKNLPELIGNAWLSNVLDRADLNQPILLNLIADFALDW